MKQLKVKTQLKDDDGKYGNTESGDGIRYRRRGFFGLRGRTMYERLEKSIPEYQALANPDLVAMTQNSILIAAKLWNNPDLLNKTSLTPYADGSFYGFSMLWYHLYGNTEGLSTGAKYYAQFLRQLQCGGDLFSGQGPSCSYNATHNGTCSATCIKGLEDFSTFCGCSGPSTGRCPDSPANVRCCLDQCTQELKMDLGLVLDASGSITLPNYKIQLNFTQDLLRRVNVGLNKTHVAIINYSDKTETLTRLNSDFSLDEKIRRVLQATYFSSGTNTAQGLQAVNTAFSYQNGRRQAQEGVTSVIFLITDGKSNNRDATIKAADTIKKNNIVVVSVGVGEEKNLDLVELRAVCSPPATENYFSISNYSALNQKLSQFTSKSCSEPTPLVSNTTATLEVGKDKYKFIKIQIILFGNQIMITIKIKKGNVKLFYSFKNRNPKDPAEFIDYETTNKLDESLWARIKSYFQAKTGTTRNSDISMVTTRPDNNTEFIYVGVKGIENDNKFDLKLDDCSKTTCIVSSACSIKLSMILAFLSYILIF